MSGVFQKLPEALDDLIKDVLPQSLIHVLRVRKLDVGQDDLLVEPQQVRSGKQDEAADSLWFSSYKFPQKHNH